MAQLAKAFHRPHVHDGDYSEFRRRRFGAPADDVPPRRFVVFSQNHDQVGNRAFGDRLPEPARPLAAFCTLLSPFVPLLFMGEEYGETAPFQFFSDHIDKRIADATREGRRREFAAFAEFGEEVPDPQDVGHVRALQAHPPARPGAGATCTRELLAARRGCRRATPTRSSSTRPRGGCGCAAARSSSSATSPREPRASRAGDHRRAVTHEPPRTADGRRSFRRCRER